MRADRRRRIVAAAGVVLALSIVPAPLLPPHRLAETVQTLLEVKWPAAYLLASLGLQGIFYCAVGALASVSLAQTIPARPRAVHILVAPFLLVALAFAIRSVKLGHLPMAGNAVLPMLACVFGYALGMCLLHRGWRLNLSVIAAMSGAAVWGMFGSVSGAVSAATHAHLERLIAVGPGLPSSDERFRALWEAAFAPFPGSVPGASAVQHNRAAILALGIVLGHERLSRYAGLSRDSEAVRAAVLLRDGTTLQSRDDWSRHFALSAALAVLEHPLVSDAAGLIKEELDALAGGSGFSFGDLAADRAGVRFASLATGSEASALTMQARVSEGLALAVCFPRQADLPENLTLEQFRSKYRGVGSTEYRAMLAAIDAALERCAALADPA